MDEVLFDGYNEPRMEENKRLARVLRIAALLSSQPRQWKRAGLATSLEVSRRAIDRDLEMLRNLGYEITRTAHGYYFARTPALPAVQLTIPEVLALTLAAGLARDGGDVDTAVLGGALAQLEALMPQHMQPLIRRQALRQTTISNARKQRRTALQTMYLALLQMHRVRITYATASRDGAVSERVIEPYAVFHYDHSWYVTALDHLRDAVRDFKLDRIQAATILPETYTIPADFDMARYRGSAWGILRGEATEPVEIVLLFDAESGRWAQEEHRDDNMTFDVQPDGRVRARVTAGITNELVRWILWWGPGCRVELPATLRERVKEMVSSTLALYAVSDQDSSVTDKERR